MSLHSSQRGATLIEAVAFLAIAIAIVLGALSVWSMAASTSRENQARQEIIGMQNGVRSLFQNQSSYAGLDNALALKAGVVPTTLKIAGTSIRNPWNGAVALSPAGSNLQFVIAYDNIPEDACVKLATINSDFEQVQINNGSLSVPVSVPSASSQCRGRSNSLRFLSN